MSGEGGGVTCPTPEKREYRTKRKALLARDRIREFRGRMDLATVATRAYRCECGAWHLTSSSVVSAEPARVPLVLTSGGLTFPTRPRAPRRETELVGMPRRARACRCEHPLGSVDGDCIRCGHWLRSVVDETWAHRARQLVAGSRRSEAA